jgi:hypothetical protein
MSEDNSFDRRQFLTGTVAVGTTLSLAGCSLLGGDSGDDSSESDTSNDTTDGSDDSNATRVASGSEIAIGDTVRGTLTEDAPRAPYQDRIAVPYKLEVDKQRRVRISHESDVFETYLILTDESETVVRRNAGSTSLSDNPPGPTVC